VSYRRVDTLQFLFKPAAKLATAAGVKGLLFSSEDLSVKEILGNSWPLYFSCKDEFVEKYEHLRRNPDTELALLGYVESLILEKLSPSSIAKHFVKIYFDKVPKCVELL
jgi:hypothetical protein